MSAKQKSGLLVVASIFLPLLLSACSTPSSQGLTSAITGRVPPTISNTSFKKQDTPLPYEVQLSGTSDDRMLCDNCGNTGKKVLIKGGENLTQYNMMVETAYFTFLCTRTVGGCWTGSWVAINKNLARPYVEKVWLGSNSDIRNIIPSNDQRRTLLQVTYQDGTQKVFIFDNDK